MSEPIAYSGRWRATVGAAGYRCQCTGQCGSAHAKSKGRCPREHEQCASHHRGPVHLIAAPADPGVGALEAARLPARSLRAWCPDCHDGARRAGTRAARTQPDPGQGSLF